MIAATVPGIFFVPLLFVSVRRLFKGATGAGAPVNAAGTSVSHSQGWADR